MPPSQLQSKFISTYGKLLQSPATIPPTEERFWDDVFCLTPDVAWLRDKMSGLGRAGLLGTHQHVITAIFAAAKSELCSSAEDAITPIDTLVNPEQPSPAENADGKSNASGRSNGNGTSVDVTSTLRRMNAARTLQVVAQAVLSVPGITGWEIMDVLAGGVGVSDAVFT